VFKNDFNESTGKHDPHGAEVTPLAVNMTTAAKLLGIGTRKLWELTNRGEIPHVRIGRSVRYPVEDLRAWLSQRTNGKGGTR